MLLCAHRLHWAVYRLHNAHHCLTHDLRVAVAPQRLYANSLTKLQTTSSWVGRLNCLASRGVVLPGLSVLSIDRVKRLTRLHAAAGGGYDIMMI